MIKLSICILCWVWLSGCAGLINNHEFTPVAADAISIRPVARVTPGAIYSPGRDMRLFEDRTARRVGDIVKVRLVERTQASKKATTNVSKDSEISLLNPVLFGQAIGMNAGKYSLAAEVEGSRNFGGAGESGQSNSLQGQLSAVVVDVYSNGNLAIRGEKMLTLNQGQEYVQISGVIRADDIAPDNSILSTQVADAQITYGGKGALDDANVIGWLGRFFLSPLWPF